MLVFSGLQGQNLKKILLFICFSWLLNETVVCQQSSRQTQRSFELLMITFSYLTAVENKAQSSGQSLFVMNKSVMETCYFQPVWLRGYTGFTYSTQWSACLTEICVRSYYSLVYVATKEPCMSKPSSKLDLKICVCPKLSTSIMWESENRSDLDMKRRCFCGFFSVFLFLYVWFT